MKRQLGLYTLILLAWGLRVRELGVAQLWFDEAASHFIAVRSPHNILQYVAAAPFEHPPGYYLLLHGTMKVFGETEWALRFPSVLLGTLLVVGIWRFACRWGDDVALSAATLAALSPFLITYSQEARMYALVQCLGLVATALLLRFLRRPSPLLALGYAGITVLGIVTHYYFAFLILAHWVITACCAPRGRRAYLVGGAVLAINGIAAAGWYLSRAPGPRTALAQVLGEGLRLKEPEAVGRLATDWAFGGATIVQRPAWALPLASAGLLVLLLALLWGHAIRRDRAILALWIGVPTVLAILVPYGGLVLRHFSYITPALFVLGGVALAEAHRRSCWLPLLPALALAASSGLGLVWTEQQRPNDYRAALQTVAREAEPGDALLLANPHQWVSYSYYGHSGLPVYLVGDGRPVPAEALAASRLWRLQWETWALPDWEAVSQSLAAWPHAYDVAFSQDVRLALLVTPSELTDGPGATWQWDGVAGHHRGTLAGAEVTAGQDLQLSLCNGGGTPGDEGGTALHMQLIDAGGYAWAEQQAPAPEAAGSNCTGLALHVPRGTPASSYQLRLAAMRDGSYLRVRASDGTALGPWVALGEVAVTAPGPRSGTPSSSRWYAVGRGWHMVPPAVAVLSSVPGGQVDLAMELWPTAAAPRYDLPVQLRSGLATNVLPPSQLRPASGDSLTMGDVARLRLVAAIPQWVKSGAYELQVQRTGWGGGALRWLDRLAPGVGWVTIARVEVHERPLAHVDGTPALVLDLPSSDGVRLYGADSRLEGGTLRLQLYWDAPSPVGKPYVVFVHLVAGNDGTPLAQADAPPGSAPTSAWRPGERFASDHSLTLPEEVDDLRLRIGLYDEETMQRLTWGNSGCDYLEFRLHPDGALLLTAP